MKEVLKELKKHNIQKDFELCDVGYNDLILTSEMLQLELLKDENNLNKYVCYFDCGSYQDNLTIKEIKNIVSMWITMM